MRVLAEQNRDKVLDLLAERLTFERAAVRLYDQIMEKMKSDGGAGRMMNQLHEFRDQEKEHEEWLEDQIRKLGGDTHAKTDRADLIERESEGIESVVRKDMAVSHLLHALLTAELVDNSGWQLLIELADDADDDDARRAFKKRLHEEEEHLIFVRRAVVALARRDVLGQQVPIPASL